MHDELAAVAEHPHLQPAAVKDAPRAVGVDGSGASEEHPDLALRPVGLEALVVIGQRFHLLANEQYMGLQRIVADTAEAAAKVAPDVADTLAAVDRRGLAVACAAG